MDSRLLPLHDTSQRSADKRLSGQRKEAGQGPDEPVGNARLLVALPRLSSRLLLDAAEIDLPDKRFRDDIERVDLLLH